MVAVMPLDKGQPFWSTTTAWASDIMQVSPTNLYECRNTGPWRHALLRFRTHMFRQGLDTFTWRHSELFSGLGKDVFSAAQQLGHVIMQSVARGSAL